MSVIVEEAHLVAGIALPSYDVNDPDQWLTHPETKEKCTVKVTNSWEIRDVSGVARPVVYEFIAVIERGCRVGEVVNGYVFYDNAIKTRRAVLTTPQPQIDTICFTTRALRVI